MNYPNSYLLLALNKNTIDIHTTRILALNGIFTTSDYLWSSPSLVQQLSTTLNVDLTSFITCTNKRIWDNPTKGLISKIVKLI